MYEEAQEVFDYLPIRRETLENDYINHLWQVFITLDGSGTVARPFAVMPFHLLFMMAMQYKVLRIANTQKHASDLFFSGVGGRNKEQLLSEQRSVFDIALINERTMPEIFQLIGLDSEIIKEIKDLVDDRNDKLAHAKGGIELEPEIRIEEYLVSLRAIQICMQPLNDGIASEWGKDLTTEDDGKEFIESRLLDSYLCLEDFKTGILESKFGEFIM
jgi:hypothetical protein